METAIGLMLAASPIVLTIALLQTVEWRQARVQAEIARQIALTDALHARLGALVAPVVRWRGRVWQVSVAVPAEEPAVVGAVLATTDEVFGRAPYELRLRPQTAAEPAAPTRRAARRVGALSWT
jgi:hypothetical protein